MAKVTEDKTLQLSVDEALKLVRNADGKVKFGVHVRVWLPTTEERGFDSGSGLTVSKAEMLKIIESAARGFEARGAKVELKLQAPRYKGSHAWIWLS